MWESRDHEILNIPCRFRLTRYSSTAKDFYKAGKQVTIPTVLSYFENQFDPLS